MLRRLLCRLGLHHWDMPGGHCTEKDCRKCDEFFGAHVGCWALVLALLLAPWPALAGGSVSNPRPAPTPPVAQHDHQVEDRLATSMLVYTSLAAADLWSTAYCLEKNPRCAEGNPLGFNGDARMALKLGSLGVIGYTDYRLRRAGHHTTATVMRCVLAGIEAGIVVHNIREAHAR